MIYFGGKYTRLKINVLILFPFLLKKKDRWEKRHFDFGGKLSRPLSHEDSVRIMVIIARK